MVRDTAWRPGGLRLRAIPYNNRCPRSRTLATTAAWLVALIVLLLAGTPAAATCVDASTLAHSAVSIARYFADEDRKADSDLLGIRGTAWFLSPTSMVTVEHVAAAMSLSDKDWTQVEVFEGQNRQLVDVRILRLAGTHTEKIAVLELRTAFAGAQVLQIRQKPLALQEQVVGVAFVDRRLRFVGGQFIRYGDGDKLGGTALLEMFEGDNRLAIDHGASGAPVVDCEGRVVAVVSNIFTQTLQFPSRAIRVSTAWGSPNVVAVPSQILTLPEK